MFLCVLRLFLSDSNEEHVRTTDKHCMDGVQVSSVDCSCSVLAFLFLFPETGEPMETADLKATMRYY